MPKHIKNSRRSNGLPTDLVSTLVLARRGHAWSQRDLAGKVGLPQAHISAIETGKVVPRYDTMLDLVRVLDHDLLLVPRSLVPTVQSLIRDARSADGNNIEEGERPLYATDAGAEE